jgi:hypothetical protein
MDVGGPLWTLSVLLVAGAGKRFESARRLSLTGLDKLNTRNRESPRVLTGGYLIPL